MTTVAGDCDAKTMSLDNLKSEVVQVITQKLSEIPLCVRLIPLAAGTVKDDDIPGTIAVSIPNF